MAKDERLKAVARLFQEDELEQALHRIRAILAERAKIIVYVGNIDLTQFRVKPIVIDASLLHGNNSVLHDAYDRYHKRKMDRQKDLAAG
jgi:hypothetical protein